MTAETPGIVASARQSGMGSGECGVSDPLMGDVPNPAHGEAPPLPGDHQTAAIIDDLLSSRDPSRRTALRAVLRQSRWPELMRGGPRHHANGYKRPPCYL
jgi:hypothetical protein